MSVISLIIFLDATVPLLSVYEEVYRPVIRLTSLLMSSTLSLNSQHRGRCKAVIPASQRQLCYRIIVLLSLLSLLLRRRVKIDKPIIYLKGNFMSNVGFSPTFICVLVLPQNCNT